MSKTRTELVTTLADATKERDFAIKYGQLCRQQLQMAIASRRNTEARLQHTLRMLYALVLKAGGALPIDHNVLAELPVDLEVAIENKPEQGIMIVRIPTEAEIIKARSPEPLTLGAIRSTLDLMDSEEQAALSSSLVGPDGSPLEPTPGEPSGSEGSPPSPVVPNAGQPA